MIELIHIPRATDEGGREDHPLADFFQIHTVGQSIEDALVIFGSQGGLIPLDPVQPILFYLTIGIDTELLEKEATASEEIEIISTMLQMECIELSLADVFISNTT